ncbi:hypothetical protein SLEP1_g58903 [Rubroshorea leprosula]|uniref:Uncharacterized protein n=1 Tax=Rubroshorea leprosula TaxID=152421 RepID=A0AAV5MTK5_9ROSI|nr:hypothetical protein SLEP1_g58903 [Rubroshorea leprosula]
MHFMVAALQALNYWPFVFKLLKNLRSSSNKQTIAGGKDQNSSHSVCTIVLSAGGVSQYLATCMEIYQFQGV